MADEKKGVGFVTSESLIAGVNSKLDGIAQFYKVNVKALEDMVEKMKTMGFQNPFKPAVIGVEQAELSAEARRDVVRQLRLLRDTYLMKKHSLKRARVSLAAHKLYEHINSTGRFSEAKDHLPLDGNYIKLIASFDLFCYEAYLKLMEFLGTTGKYEHSALVKIKRMEKGNEIVENFKIINPQNIAERVKAVYGNDADILGIRFLNPERRLIKGAEYRVALASALAAHAYDSIVKEGKNKESSELVKKYNSIISKYGVSKFYRIDLVDGYEELKEELAKEELGQFDGSEFFIDEELAKDVESTKNRISKKVFIKAKSMFQAALLEYLVSKQETSFVPNFAVKNNTLYGEVFKEFYVDDVKLDIGKAVLEFLELRHYDLLEPNVLIAAVMVRNGVDPKMACKVVGVADDELAKGSKVLESTDLKKLREFHGNN